jgi:hypothetical protein
MLSLLVVIANVAAWGPPPQVLDGTYQNYCGCWVGSSTRRSVSTLTTAQKTATYCLQAGPDGLLV